MKHILRALGYQLTRKRINEKRISSLHISVKKQEISYFILSTNLILSFDYQGARCYFRECPQIMPRKKFFLQSMNTFLETLNHLGIDRQHFKQDIPIKLEFSNTAIERFKAYLKEKTADGQFLKMLYNMDRLAQKARFSIWTEQTYDQSFFAAFGLGDRPKETDDISIYFIWYIRSVAARYRTLRIVRGRKHSYFNAVRALASEAVAEAVGLEHMATNTRFCTLHMEDGSELFGLLSDSAPGLRMMDTHVEPSGSLQRELMDLFLLDILCYQMDHGPNNYSVTVDENGTASVCAFDNDSPVTFFPHCTVSRPLAGCTPLKDKKGRILRPFVGREIARRIQAVNTHKLGKQLAPYLNRLQIAALSGRFRLLRKAIREAQKQNENFLIPADGWGEQTVKCEMSGKYGMTYLTKALQQQDSGT